jgi:sigma-B regulation protein RsbU (phosphoserine phosphatase)
LTELPIKECFPLGVSPTEGYVTQSTELPPGSSFLLYTDGVTEAMQEDGEQYNQRLLSVLEGQRDVTPAELIRSVRTDLSAFVGNAPQTDDITLLAVHCP